MPFSYSKVLPGIPVTPRVKFTFSFQPVDRQLLYQGPDRRMLVSYENFLKKIVNTFYFGIELAESSVVREAIKKILRRWPLSDPQLHKIIMLAEKVLQGYTGGPDILGHNAFEVHVQVTRQRNYIYVTDEVRDALITQRLMAEYVLRMVPATDESIKKLERKKITTDCDENSCMICLEELSAGGLGILMPCSHMFHGDCIQEWLKTSHYCPICRFEMPTEEITS